MNTRKLEGWFEDNVLGYRGPLVLEKFADGQSNPTYKVRTGGPDYVLRRKPSGKLLPGAHAVEREYRVITALGAVGFPVPATVGLCEDDTVFETPFYVMELVEGRIFWDPTLPEVPAEQRRAYYEALSDVLARLHLVDYRSAGLGDFGKPGNYFARQIKRWAGQYQLDEKAGRLDAMDRLCDWLPAHIPPGDETALCHGDYRCDNVIFHAQDPRVVAVLDWELSTLGHPLADFTYHLMKYRTPRGLPAGMAGRDPRDLGLPTEEEYVAMYCKRTGRDGIDHLDFYMAYNLFRLAAIVHGIKGRLLRGNASNARAESLVKLLEPLADSAWQQAKKAGAG